MKGLILAPVCALAFIAAPLTAHAAASLPNGTTTTYDAVAGSVAFEWDLSSAYSITGTDVTVHVDDIVIPGPAVVGTLYEFVIPNFYDPLPKKTITVTLEGGNSDAQGLELPTVLDIIGADSAYGIPSPALPVVAEFVSGSSTSTLVVQEWVMFPNPDFEIVKIFAPIDFDLQLVTIETQSVPLPAAAWLFGAGLVGLMRIARRA